LIGILFYSIYYLVIGVGILMIVLLIV
jgi:hypothetical protein